MRIGNNYMSENFKGDIGSIRFFSRYLQSHDLRRIMLNFHQLQYPPLKPNTFVFNDLPNTQLIEGSLLAGGPFNVYQRTLHHACIYLKSELNSIGMFGPAEITMIGWEIVKSMPRPALNFSILMGHIASENTSEWSAGTYIELLHSASVQITNTGWFMLPLSTPFTWNGEDNIIIRTCFGQNTSDGDTDGLEGGYVRLIQYTNTSSLSHGTNWDASNSVQDTGCNLNIGGAWPANAKPVISFAVN